MATIVEAALANLAADKPKTAAQVAVAIGAEATGEPIKKVVRKAKEAFARSVEQYVALHMEATINAAAKGNALPAQWALEHISEGGERVVEAAKAAPTPQGAVSIGVMIGGIPQPRLTTATIDTTATVVDDE